MHSEIIIEIIAILKKLIIVIYYVFNNSNLISISGFPSISITLFGLVKPWVILITPLFIYKVSEIKFITALFARPDSAASVT